MSRGWVPAVAMVLGVSLGGCAVVSGDAASSSDAPPVTHVHAVDVDDERQRLTIATHDGLVAVDLSPQEPVTDVPMLLGDLRADVMGFVRVDDGFLISGHPVPGSTEPANLGVVWTDLEGIGWQPRALSGSAEFHAMARAVVGDARVIVGLDSVSGGVMVSRDDGLTWRAGAGLLARDLAVEPGSGRILATTEAGLLVSNDDAATWQPLDDAPRLVLVEVAEVAGAVVIVGVDTELNLWTADPAGGWQRVGPVPFAPEGLGIGAEGTIAIASTAGAAVSSDGGASWRQVARFDSGQGAESDW